MGDKGLTLLEELSLQEQATITLKTGEIFSGSGKDVAEFIRSNPRIRWTQITFGSEAAKE